MTIIKATLKDYTRVSLADTQSLTIVPEDSIQMILGTNGCGKSSLANELSPLPGDPNDFEEGGSKYILMEHAGKRYELFNDYSKPNKHSFRLEGSSEELNPGGGIKMQRDLCKQYFGLTDRIHQMRLGLPGQTFSSMGPEARRYWFTEMSETNYDYALSLFKKLKERHRDVAGARKLAQKRLVVETSKIMSEAERIILEEDTESLYTILRMVTEVRQPVEGDAVAMEQAYQASIAQIEKIATQVIKLKGKISSFGMPSAEAIDVAIKESKLRYDVKQHLSSKLSDEHQQITKLLGDVAESGVQNAAEIEAALNDITKKQTALRVNRNIVREAVENAQDLLNQFDNVRQPIEMILMDLPENTDRRFTPAIREEQHQRVLNTRDLSNGSEKAIIKMEANKSHLEAHQKADLTECPNCGHNWKIGFNELVYKDLCERLLAAKDVFNAAQELLPKEEAKLAEIDEYLTKYRNLFSYVNGWPQLKPLWDHLIQKKYFLEDPRKAMTDMGLFQIDMTSEVHCNRMDEEREVLYRQLRLKQELGNQDATRLKERMEKISEELHENAVEMAAAQKETQRMEQLAADVRMLQRLHNELVMLTTSTRETNDKLIEHLRRSSILQVIRELQSQLARKEDILNSVKLQVGIIEDLKTNIQSLEVDESSLAALLKELSPTDGLIAEGLLGFIKVFVARMNAFIAQIWAYPLTVVPCEPDADGGVDLDYRFPIMVKEDKRSDVSKGSMGIKEVIDMAFIVTSMRQMGLQDSPLFLDEFAKAMDTTHRFQAIQAVKNLVEEQHFTQLFIISHNLEFHGAFPNAQVCVLDGENIMLPANMKYNEHVQFVKSA